MLRLDDEAETWLILIPLNGVVTGKMILGLTVDPLQIGQLAVRSILMGREFS